LLIPERLIEAVITNQFQTAFQATSNYNTIELSGLGKFSFNQKKAQKQMVKYQEQLVIYNDSLFLATTPEEKKNITLRLNTLNKNIDHLKPKLK